MTENIKLLRELLEHWHVLEGGNEDYTLIKCMVKGRRVLSKKEIQEVKEHLTEELNDGCKVSVRAEDDQPFILNVTIEYFTNDKLRDLLQRLQGQESVAATIG
jgi:hypothetical protein